MGDHTRREIQPRAHGYTHKAILQLNTKHADRKEGCLINSQEFNMKRKDGGMMDSVLFFCLFVCFTGFQSDLIDDVVPSNNSLFLKKSSSSGIEQKALFKLTIFECYYTLSK